MDIKALYQQGLLAEAAYADFWPHEFYRGKAHRGEVARCDVW